MKDEFNWDSIEGFQLKECYELAQQYEQLDIARDIMVPFSRMLVTLKRICKLLLILYIRFLWKAPELQNEMSLRMRTKYQVLLILQNENFCSLYLH